MLEREELLKALRPIINGTISKKLYKDNSVVIGDLRNALGRLLWFLDSELKPYTDKNRTTDPIFTFILDDYVIWSGDSLLIDPDDWKVWSISDLKGNTLAYYNRYEGTYKGHVLNYREAEKIINGASRKWRAAIDSESEELSEYFEEVREQSIELLGALLNK